ncbi:MAG: hypothetical protein M4579_006826 [Chaenotheca gracillima]|nr:MAG: hypothetical protein M4579_006826 [Chaenotheca gracillima]
MVQEAEFVKSLEDLTGRVAIVTGGAGGIGLEITIYLAQLGATVYIAARNREKSEKGIEEARARLQGKEAGEIKFHPLDLSTIAGAKRSAVEFSKIETRLDIIVANAAIGFYPQDELSSDNWEKAFATNHLGHFAFITELLDLVESTAKSHGQARIVTVSSTAALMSPKIDYEALRRVVENDGKSIWDLKNGAGRYANSKLANVLFMTVLDQKMQERGFSNIYCNSCHPGMVTTTSLGGEAGDKILGATGAALVRSALGLFSNSGSDAAKTPVYLAASSEVQERGVHGEYWQPTWTWTRAFKSTGKGTLTAVAQDQEEQEKLWDRSQEAVEEALIRY